ncbi:uncharacterized protein PV07_08723 [Cladophialophora immunda]|uniref:Uncharacterized protein n=1 Tax=Cladophialophora immunda TaxID=569365 RepID=A0A0D1ZCV1_9EURO|nr:uncharacterized protein PV07_08723 [Cladophialophora immunda]KIW25556.1 hypothetical protein PV07_08723 [Cladophialophora immunda]
MKLVKTLEVGFIIKKGLTLCLHAQAQEYAGHCWDLLSSGVQSGAGGLTAERKQTIRNTIEEIEDAQDTVSFVDGNLNLGRTPTGSFNIL